MQVIGITGGVGAGKSAILEYLSKVTKCEIIRADDVANEIKEKGNPVYERVIAVLGEDIVGADGEIDRNMMSVAIFGDKSKKRKVEAIIFPEVKREILARISRARASGTVDYVFIEAALLIEEGYQAVCNEIWYVYASVATRTRRLHETRGYTFEKIESIIDTQLKEKEFRENCDREINNNEDFEEAKACIDRIIGKE